MAPLSLLRDCYRELLVVFAKRGKQREITLSDDKRWSFFIPGHDTTPWQQHHMSLDEPIVLRFAVLPTEVRHRGVDTRL